jgi:hypothetical protein
MNNNIQSVSKRLYLATILTVTALSTSAFATTTAAFPVQIVKADTTNLWIDLGSGGVYAASLSGTPGACSNTPIDAFKSWQNLAEAALLSGKSVKITFTTCSGTNYINRVDLYN